MGSAAGVWDQGSAIAGRPVPLLRLQKLRPSEREEFGLFSGTRWTPAESCPLTFPVTRVHGQDL